jgi:EAL and modified HD-GYP domain-containing signal transduction protein
LANFIARQPIFDRRQRVFAYELFFRAGLESIIVADEAEQDNTMAIADGCLSVDLKSYTGGKPAFLKVTPDLLLKGYAALLPTESAVLEISAKMDLDSELTAHIQKLSKRGYGLAIDDVAEDAPEIEPLLELANIIKVDFLATDKEQREALLTRFRSQETQVIAKNVATQEDFREALDLGYDFFQGHFFRVPPVIENKEVKGLKVCYLQLLNEVNHAGFDIAKLENIIKRDVSLTYKLLRYINSAFFGCRSRVRSVRHALLLLGSNEIKKWSSLVLVANLAEDRPHELVIQALIRAGFCEALALGAGLTHRDQELFLMGMFSMLDSILGQPMDEILESVPVPDDIKEALCGDKNRARHVLECVLAYEQADWETLGHYMSHLGLSEEGIPEIYQRVLHWVHESSGDLDLAA